MVSSRQAALVMLLAGASTVAGHSSFIVKEKYCNLPLVVGQKIMGQKCVAAPATNIVQVLRDGTALADDAVYTPGEKLTISFATQGEVGFEADGGSFTKGGCDGKRGWAKGDAAATADPSTVLTMPEDGFDVKIKAGFATKKGAVAITTDAVIKGPNGPRAATPAAVPQARTLR